MTKEDANELTAGAGGTIKIGESLYLVSPPSDEDFATLRAEIRRRTDPIKALSATYADYPTAMRADLMDAAVKLKAAGGIEITEALIRQQLHEPAVVAFLAWLLARSKDPALKLETVEKAVTKANFAQVLSDLGEATGMALMGKKEASTGPNG